MCVYSMIMDHYTEKWGKYVPPEPPRTIPLVPWDYPPYWPDVLPAPEAKPPISPEEIEEFRELLRRAKAYDKNNNEPDCELESKKAILKELAEKLGVEIDFV